MMRTEAGRRAEEEEREARRGAEREDAASIVGGEGVAAVLASVRACFAVVGVWIGMIGWVVRARDW
jgi:hypothetical protein